MRLLDGSYAYSTCTVLVCGVYMLAYTSVHGSVLLTHRTPGSEVRAACDFLLSHQMEDGGWGEDFAVSP